VVDRGQCTFVQKAENAQANGAIAVLILNNAGGGAIPLPAARRRRCSPCCRSAGADGNSLKTKLMAGAVTADLKRVAVIDRDGTIDNAIVAHEWGHYIQNRLVGDGNGLTNYQASGMAEGWADVHAMLLVVKGEDAMRAANANFSGVYALASYTMYGADPNAYYWGIRRAPYSTDMTKNPFTFKHIQEGWRCRPPRRCRTARTATATPSPRDRRGVGPDAVGVLRDAAARHAAAHLRAGARPHALVLVAAYKITPLMPTFVEAATRCSRRPSRSTRPTSRSLRCVREARQRHGAVAPDRDRSTTSPSSRASSSATSSRW